MNFRSAYFSVLLAWYRVVDHFGLIIGCQSLYVCPGWFNICPPAPNQEREVQRHPRDLLHSNLVRQDPAGTKRDPRPDINSLNFVLAFCCATVQSVKDGDVEWPRVDRPESLFYFVRDSYKEVQ